MRSILQTDVWAKLKESQGWQVGKWEEHFGLSRSLFLNKKILYFPEIAFDEAGRRLVDMFTSVSGEGKGTYQPLMARFEFLDEWSKEGAAWLLDRGLIKSFESVQPEYRQIIDITPDEDEILTQMKKKGRYDIAIAKKSHLSVEWGKNEELVKQFSSLYLLTAKRAKFHGRSEAYFQKLVAALPDDAVEVIVVSHENTPLAAGIFTYFDGVASYLYGGSHGERELMAPYLLHWSAIERAKKRHCQKYDLLAVAPPDAPNHPYAGLTRFKQQFGGRTIRTLGSWDLVFQPVWYKLYQVASRVRRGRKQS